ncbi:hypothetical protein RFI_18046 [Reticulomyxa filosa]|uniref:Uncharacterized protein n=1 Tax=Reticulomyxa filosa TaxID=46433 RepID=X6N0B6_RETFI|nr:hypothetical protein RFI_18046 [Reticulomyxa filosa]|eukprot:ETO19184.1 hypothetical protein RFI_18046 [Reticulomyxa filosa]
MLADVASIQLLVQQLPNIPYWTEMVILFFVYLLVDFYMYTCFFYLFLITSWSCFVGINEEDLGPADNYALIFFLILWIFSNFIFITRAFILFHQERASLDYSKGQLKKYYRESRSDSDRSAIECKFTIDKVDEQDFDDTLLFDGRKAKKGVVIPQRENELLRLGTILSYGLR